MSKFLSLLPKTVAKAAKRLGRGLGSGRGAKSGRGTTRHQKTREKTPLHFEGGQSKITKKYPLLRGKGRNKAVRPKAFPIGFEILNKFKDGETVNIENLIKKGLIDKRFKKIGVKILANGEIKKKLIIKVSISSAAKAAIEKLGGQVESL